MISTSVDGVGVVPAFTSFVSESSSLPSSLSVPLDGVSDAPGVAVGVVLPEYGGFCGLIGLPFGIIG